MDKMRKYKTGLVGQSVIILIVLSLVLCLGVGSCKDRDDSQGVEELSSGQQGEKSAKLTQPEKTGEVRQEEQILADESAGDKSVGQGWTHPRTQERLGQRVRMAKVIEEVYGLKDAQVLAALEHVPRHWFVTESEQRRAYADMPLPIGHGQTISQPFIVAYMTSLQELDSNKKVLEVGTGSGYQAAVLTEFTPHVFSIEIIEPLAQAAAARMKKLGYETVQVKAGDGYWGWQEEAPFDAILVTCAVDHIPAPLIEQLKKGGSMCIPVGSAFRVQHLMLISKDSEGKVTSKSLMPVRFVPLTRSDKP